MYKETKADIVIGYLCWKLKKEIIKIAKFSGKFLQKTSWNKLWWNLLDKKKIKSKLNDVFVALNRLSKYIRKL